MPAVESDVLFVQQDGNGQGCGCGCGGDGKTIVFRSVWDRLVYQLFGSIPIGMAAEEQLPDVHIYRDNVVLLNDVEPYSFSVVTYDGSVPMPNDVIEYKGKFYIIGAVTQQEQEPDQEETGTTYSCTGCIGIDHAIIDAYKMLSSTEEYIESAESLRVTAESGRVLAEQGRVQQAAADHNTASSDHGIAAADHRTAMSDSVTAATDHLQAIQDHGIAVADHGIAESDHSASTSATTRANTAAAEAEHMVDIKTGPAGKSAYQLAVDNGFEGTIEQWFASLTGPQGVPGVNNTTMYIVTTLPTASQETLSKVYLIYNSTTGEYDRYYTAFDGTNYSMVQMGSMTIDLGDYVRKDSEVWLTQEEFDALPIKDSTKTYNIYEVDDDIEVGEPEEETEET